MKTEEFAKIWEQMDGRITTINDRTKKHTIYIRELTKEIKELKSKLEIVEKEVINMEELQENKVEKPLTTEEVNLDDIEGTEPKPMFDARKYDGSRVKIASATTKVIDSHYVDGKYDSNQTVKQDVLIIETEPVEILKMEDGDKPICANAKFNLVRGEDGKLSYSKHPKGALHKFMRKMGVAKISELVGGIVTLTVEPSKDEGDDRVWLRIVQ